MNCTGCHQDGGEGKGHATGGRDRLFLSSTSIDLAEYRERVTAAISRLQQQSVGMETVGAEPRTPLETCLRRVKQADALVLIVAHRYGWVPSVGEGGDGKKSITGTLVSRIE